MTRRVPSRARAPATLMLLVLPLAGGCALYEDPKLDVTGAALTDESAEGLVVTFTVAATNPNREELPLREVRYTLWLDGRQVFSGSRSPEATLARLAIQELRLPAAVVVSTEHPRPLGLVPYHVRGELTYITPGKLADVLYDSGFPAPTASFSREGTVDLGGRAAEPGAGGGSR